MAWWRITDADIKDSRIFGFWNIFAPGLRVIMGKHTLWTRGMSWKSVCAMPFHVHAPKWLQSGMPVQQVRSTTCPPKVNLQTSWQIHYILLHITCGLHSSTCTRIVPRSIHHPPLLSIMLPSQILNPPHRHTQNLQQHHHSPKSQHAGTPCSNYAPPRTYRRLLRPN